MLLLHVLLPPSPPPLFCNSGHGEQTDYHDEFMSPQRYVGLNYDKILPCVGLSDNDLQFF